MTKLTRVSSPGPVVVLSCLLLLSRQAGGGDQPQWGIDFSRNQVSAERGLPVEFDPASGESVLWKARLGTSSYATPVVAKGRVFVGTNNDNPRDPKHTGDRGVMLCLDERTGKLLWQLLVPKRVESKYFDWPRTGICSPASVEGDRVYLVNNRAEVMCLDIDGLADGNDGPFLDEARHMTPAGTAPVELAATDADILWLFNIPQELGVRNHDAMHNSAMIHGRFIYSATGNGLDGSHFKMLTPEAPSLLALDKWTGRLVATDNERIGPNIIHSTWSSPSCGKVGGRELVFFGGGDAVVYAFKALKEPPLNDVPQHFEKVWSFDCDPDSPKENILKWQDNRREGPSLISGMPVFHQGKVYVTAGGDYWHGKPTSWLKCIDAAGNGDITRSGAVWSYEMSSFCMSTPAIHEGLAYIVDCGGVVHCVDAKSGRAAWTHDTKAEIWSSPLVADGRVYVGTQDGTFFVFAARARKTILRLIDLPSPMNATVTVANGKLFLTTMDELFVIGARDRQTGVFESYPWLAARSPRR